MSPTNVCYATGRPIGGTETNGSDLTKRSCKNRWVNLTKLTAIGSSCGVQVWRKHGDCLCGVIAATGRKWMLLHVVWDLDLNGLTAIRLSDIKKLSIDNRGDDVLVRSLQQRAIFPRPVEGMDLDTTSELLADVQRRHRLVTVHPERRWPGTCHVGFVTGIDSSRKRFSMLELSPAAVYDGQPTLWRFRDVRRIELADTYAAALESLAGQPSQASH
jgi:hypothetical protein